MKLALELLSGEYDFEFYLSQFNLTHEIFSIDKRLSELKNRLEPRLNPLFEKTTHGRNLSFPIFIYDQTPLLINLQNTKLKINSLLLFYELENNIDSNYYQDLLIAKVHINNLTTGDAFHKKFNNLSLKINDLQKKVARWYNYLSWKQFELCQLFLSSKSNFIKLNNKFKTQYNSLHNLLNNTMQHYELFLSKKHLKNTTKKEYKFNLMFKDLAKIIDGEIVHDENFNKFTLSQLISFINKLLSLKSNKWFFTSDSIVNILTRQVGMHCDSAYLIFYDNDSDLKVLLQHDFQIETEVANINYQTIIEKVVNLNVSNKINREFDLWLKKVLQIKQEVYDVENSYVYPFKSLILECGAKKVNSIQVNSTYMLKDISHQRCLYYNQIKQIILNLSYWNISSHKYLTNVSYHGQRWKIPLEIKNFLLLIESQEQELKQVATNIEPFKVGQLMVLKKGYFLSEIQKYLESVLNSSKVLLSQKQIDSKTLSFLNIVYSLLTTLGVERRELQVDFEEFYKSTFVI